jgi:hypothetical protein
LSVLHSLTPLRVVGSVDSNAFKESSGLPEAGNTPMFIGLQRPLLGERPQLERRTFLTILYSSDAMKSVETLDGVF